MASSPILACRRRFSSRWAACSSSSGRPFRPHSAPAKKASRHSLSLAAVCCVSRESASMLSPFSKRTTISDLRRADQRCGGSGCRALPGSSPPLRSAYGLPPRTRGCSPESCSAEKGLRSWGDAEGSPIGLILRGRPARSGCPGKWGGAPLEAERGSLESGDMRRFALASMFALVALAALEGLSSLLLGAAGEDPQEARGRAGLRALLVRLDAELTAAEGLRTRGESSDGLAGAELEVVLHPYTAFSASNEAQRVAEAVELTRPGGGEAKPFWVLLLGGATAQTLGESAGGALVEAFLGETALAADAVKVLSFGLKDFKQPQQLNLLLHLLSLGARPDLVIDLHGRHEAVLGQANFAAKVHPTYPLHSNWLVLGRPTLDEGFAMDPELRKDLLNLEARVRHRARRWWAQTTLGAESVRRELAPEWERLHAQLEKRRSGEAPASPAIARELRGPQLEGSADGVPKIIARHQQHCLLAANAACAARGITYVGVLEPTPHDFGAQELSQTARRALVNTYARFRQSGDYLRRSGVSWIDLSQGVGSAEEEIFDASGQLTAQGAERLAQRLVSELAIQLDFAALVSRSKGATPPQAESEEAGQ